MKYRIKQISENEFIAQVKNGFLGDWFGIYYDKVYCTTFYHYSYQKEFCIVETKERAIEIINLYKVQLEKQKKYPIYIKIK